MKKAITIFIPPFLLSCDGHKKDIKTEKETGKIEVLNKIIGKENLVQTSNKKENNHWQGTYKLNIDYGKLNNVSEMSIDYDIEERLKSTRTSLKTYLHKDYYMFSLSIF
jgi:hypothetical protein